MLAVVKPDSRAFFRKICRWFSEKFNTPLPMTEDMPKEYILEHYFESIYGDMDEEDRKEEIRILLETPEERQIRLKLEAEEEDGFLAELEEEAKEFEGMDIVEISKKLKQKKKIKKALPDGFDLKEPQSLKFEEDFPEKD